VEQNIHVIDICNWILKAHPLKASATGGREGRPTDGDVYGNYHVLFHYPDGVDVTFSSTQFAKGWWDVTERFFGTKGTSQSPYAGPLGIWGDEPWQAAASPSKDTPDAKAFSVTGSFSSNLEFADPEKKKAFVESITGGSFHNQAAKGAESALSCMMARTAAYTGHEVAWDEMMKSTEVWDPGIDLNKIA
jgi:myo-inositol 2-dehydrogenase / D-chiro-inositol 1-dehydrogenase